ncbi:hypothetical protein CASFOL_040251 [Castilleja foliolosa]|uniref:Membrane protein of ER body-like protein n=1 Tax=Castilleja foliolosa TaxID=1961234 RepID=A0ABD3BF59_9LAMI
MMKVMHPQVAEEEVVEPLLTWQPDNTVPSGDITSSSSSDTQQVVDNIGISEKSVYFDKNEGMWKCHHCIWTYKNGKPRLQHVHPKSFNHSIRGNVLKLDDADIGELVNAAIKSQITVINAKGNEIVVSTEKEQINITDGTTSGVMHENVRTIDLIEQEQSDDSDDEEEEVIELEFERATEKVHTHTPYCPNCSSRITKVILRRTKKEKKRPNQDKRVDLFGCLSCFSVFIPSGNGLNPFRLFGKKEKQESSRVVEEKHELSADHAQGSENADKSTSIKQGNAFDLFRIFGKGKEKEIGQVSQDNIHKGKISNDNSTGELPVSSLHAPLLHGNKPYDHAVKDGNNNSTTIGEPQKTGLFTPPGASGELAIDISAEIGTGVTDERANTNNGSNKSLEILKCIVYGGLMETIASLSVVSSAAASDATTLNIIAIGFATVISGVFLFGHNLIDLKNDNNVVETSNRDKDKYQELLGTRGHFLLHSTFAVLSFLLFGLMPPVIYGFAFRESDDKDYKILAVAAASFACILVLAIVKAYVQKLSKWSEYVKTVFYYVTMAISVSGVSYAAGDLFKMLMERLGWFEPDPTVAPTWASY